MKPSDKHIKLMQEMYDSDGESAKARAYMYGGAEKGTAIGGGIGALGGSALMAFLSKNPSLLKKVLTGGALGGAAGGILGNLAGGAHGINEYTEDTGRPFRIKR